MNLFEQDQRQQKEIAKHKKDGYKSLTQKEWKKKKQTDPNGKFVNVETFFYGYIASATPPAPKPVETEKEKKDVKSYSEVKLPFKKTEESDAFRAWLLSKFPDYGDEVKMTKSLKVDKAPSKYKTSEALKNAYFDKGAEYVKWLSAGGKVEKVDSKTFKVIDGTYKPTDEKDKITGDEIKTKKIKRMGCKNVGDTSRFKTLSSDDSQRNDFVRDFLSWWKKKFNKIFFVPDGKCGMYPRTVSNWIYGVLYDENGDEYYAWQDENINNLANVKDTTEEGDETTYFDMWLRDRELNIRAQEEKRKEIQTKYGNNTTQNTSVVKDFEGLKLAAGNAKINPTRQNCKVLFQQTKGYNNTDKTINATIETCRSKFPLMDIPESLENKITGKLKLMKENKSLSETITNKIKSKKYEKTLSSLSEQFDKQNYRKFFDTLTKFRNNNINEATNSEFEKSFDVIFQGKETEFKNRAIEYILGKLEVSPSSELGKNIKSELDKVSAKDMFRNEYDVPEAITNAIQLSSQSNTGEETGLKGIVSQSVKFDDKQIKQGVRQHLHNYIEGVKDDIKSLEQKLKSSIVQGL
jgi:hypothetical protein